MIVRYPAQESKFWDRIDTGDGSGCWLWTGTRLPSGYGTYSRFGYAHRIVYSFLIGDIPDGLEIDHLCSVRNCVRPDHLEAVTHAENMRRGNAGLPNRSKTECPHGHPYSPENTGYHDGGRRRCLTCNKRYRKSRVVE